MLSRSSIICCLLAATSAITWGLSTHQLNQRALLEFDPNPAGIKRSPYGRTIALMLQAPAERYWRADRSVGPVALQSPLLDADQPPTATNLRKTWLRHLEKMNAATILRTNRFALTSSHQRYLYQQIEKKLATAYHIDPTNHANYALYHFFLTEGAFATREMTEEAVYNLADQTLDFVHKEHTNPEPWLTGAVAAHHKMEFMYNSLRRDNKGLETIDHQRYQSWIDEMKHCLDEFEHRRQRAINENRWNQIDPTRTAIMDENFRGLNVLLNNHKQILELSLQLANQTTTED